MSRSYFMITERTGFSHWQKEDLPLAQLLWGDSQVTCYICASGSFTPQEIRDRLAKEIENGDFAGVQYWPFFHRDSGELIGCCGLRPRSPHEYELGFHLRPQYWRQGYATEAAKAAIAYAFDTLNAQKLLAGHNPQNTASRNTLKKLGFTFIGEEFYAPTGLYHPSYELLNCSDR
ncbi:MAG: GNAT family N-acetyltransferase [Oscillospiraceae bacterium]|nr:GNAT family N-acetyltransferase [Oscillospiraceae bacterium]